MNQVLKKTLIVVLALLVAVGGVWGGLILFRNWNRSPVKVYAADMFAMTEYWGDTSTSQGFVTMEGMQSAYLSETAQVDQIYVTEGQQVKKGDPLVSYDTTLTSVDLEKAKIAIQRQNLNLEQMKAELKKLYAMRPSSGMPTVIEPSYDYVDSSALPELLTPITSDLGAKSNPVVILWDMNKAVKLQSLLKKLEKWNLLRVPTEPVEESRAVPQKAAPEEPGTEPDVTAETEMTAEPDVTGEPETTPEPEMTPEPEATLEPVVTPDPEPIPEPFVSDGKLYVVVLIRTGSRGNARNGATAAQYGFAMELNANGGLNDVSLCMDLPLPASVPEEAQATIIPDSGSGYTSAELAQMRSEKEIQIRDAELELKMAQLNLEQKEAEMNDGVIRAEMDGVIKTVNDPETVKSEQLPLVVLSAGGGYYIESTLSEWDLSELSVGDSVTVNSWMSGQSMEGTIDEISDIPSDEEDYGQRNVSRYPFRVFVSDDANLQDGEYLEVAYQKNEAIENAFYLEKIFVRNENGKNYCMVKAENGKLEKRYLKTGAELWGSYVQILGGLSLEERVAFPYGKDVLEGAQTVDAEPDELYNAY